MSQGAPGRYLNVFHLQTASWGHSDERLVTLYCVQKCCFHDLVPKLSMSSFKESTSFKSSLFFHRLKEAQENIKKITAEKRVETKKINANSLVRTDLHTAEKWNFLKVSALNSIH